MGQLDGKIALITGGASGIGRATCELFIAEGARVICADIQDDKSAALERAYNGQLKYKHCDVTRDDDIKSACDAAAAEFGGLDILFNNAGAGGSRETIAEMTAAAWDVSMNLLLRSVAMGIHHALPHMKARGGGAIVNTASIAGTQAGAGPIAYSVAKAGVIHLTRMAAAELARDNIRVNAICPGLILTDIFTPGDTTPEGLADVIKAQMRAQAPDQQPIPKAGEPLDIAKACLFFASEQSAFVTGTSLLVDGGMFVGPRQSWDPALRAERQKMIETRRAAWEAGRNG